jgi:hypothetical protein
MGSVPNNTNHGISATRTKYTQQTRSNSQHSLTSRHIVYFARFIGTDGIVYLSENESRVRDKDNADECYNSGEEFTEREGLREEERAGVGCYDGD